MQAPDTWEDWLQSYNWYAMAVSETHKKTPEVQAANFMTVIGTEAQDIFRTFSLTEKEKEMLKR